MQITLENFTSTDGWFHIMGEIDAGCGYDIEQEDYQRAIRRFKITSRFVWFIFGL
jgi:hypothetical protein